MKKIISIMLVFAFIFALSSCTKQSTSKSGTDTTKTALANQPVKLTKGPFAKENTEILNMTEKDMKAKGITGEKEDDLDVVSYYGDNYSYSFQNGKLSMINTFEESDGKNKLSKEDLVSIANEIKQQLISSELQKNYKVFNEEYSPKGDYIVKFVKRINGLNSNDSLRIELFSNGKIKSVESDLGKFDGIDKLDFDYDKAVEKCVKYAKNNDIFIYDKASNLYIGDDNCVYYRFYYIHEDVDFHNAPYYDYKICTVDQAKAYSAKS